MSDKLPADRIKEDAERYANPMVWVNQNPKGEEQLFYEYIASTSYIAGATAEANLIAPMANVLDQIAQAPTPTNEREMLSWIETARKLCEDTLQRWKEGKEVGNDSK